MQSQALWSCFVLLCTQGRFFPSVAPHPCGRQSSSDVERLLSCHLAMKKCGMKGKLSLSPFPDPASLCAILSFVIFHRFVEGGSYLHVSLHRK